MLTLSSERTSLSSMGLSCVATRGCATSALDVIADAVGGRGVFETMGECVGDGNRDTDDGGARTVVRYCVEVSVLIPVPVLDSALLVFFLKSSPLRTAGGGVPMASFSLILWPGRNTYPGYFSLCSSLTFTAFSRHGCFSSSESAFHMRATVALRSFWCFSARSPER